MICSKIIILILTLTAIILKLITYNSPHWGKTKQDGDNINMGLWELCDDGGCLKLPFKGKDGKNFPITSLWIIRVLIGIGTVITLISVYIMINKRDFGYHHLFYLVSGVAILLAPFIWIVKLLHIKKPDGGGGGVIKFTPDYALYLNIIAGFIYISISIWYMFLKKKHNLNNHHV